MGGIRVSVPEKLNHRFMLPATIPLGPILRPRVRWASLRHVLAVSRETALIRLRTGWIIADARSDDTLGPPFSGTGRELAPGHPFISAVDDGDMYRGYVSPAGPAWKKPG